MRLITAVGSIASALSFLLALFIHLRQRALQRQLTELQLVPEDERAPLV